MIKELVEIARFLYNLIGDAIDSNNSKTKLFFETKITRYYNLFSDVHKDYITSLSEYKKYIENAEAIDINSFNELINKINQDMSASFEKRSSLIILNILKEADKKRSRNIDSFFNNSQGFILAINSYLFENYKNKTDSNIQIPSKPVGIPKHVKNISDIDFERIYPEGSFCNVGREFLIVGLKKEVEKYLELQYPDAMNDFLKKKMIEIINQLHGNLTRRYLKVKLEYEALENIFIL